MLTTKAKKISIVVILGALTLIAGGATLLASPAANQPRDPVPCPHLACSLNRECVTSNSSSCTIPPGGSECNDSPPCSGG